MKYIKYIVIICSMLLFQGCPIVPKEYSLKIENNSNYNIWVFAAFPLDNLYLPTALYPDTSIAMGGRHPIKISKAYSTTSPFLWLLKKREDVFANIDTLCVFLISVDTLDKYPNLDSLNKSYNILRRYDMSLENMQKLNWTIVYPPDERMRGIKMYPPYGSPITTDTNKKE